MLQDAPDHLPIDDVSSSINAAQILEFCDPEFFEETLQNNSEVTSSSNCCYDETSPYTTNLSLPSEIEKFKTSTPTPTTTTTSTATTSTTTTTAANNYSINNNSSNLSIMFDPQDDLDNEISASIDFSSSPTLSAPQFTTTTQQDLFDNFSSVQQQQQQQQPQLSLTDFIVSADHNGLSHQYSSDTVPPILASPLPLPSAFEEDCLSSVPSYFPLDNSSASCSFLGPGMSAFLPTGGGMTSAESSGIFPGGILMGTEWQTLELDFQGDNGGIYCPDSIQHVLNHNDLQALSNDTQQLVSGATSSSAPLSSEISSLEDPSFKVGKLSVEQRREKIHRYMKKRNERNFNKKIKYACRKTLADSRPRIRGRFAKNDELGENNRAGSSNHEEDEEEDVLLKGEDDNHDMVASSDILSHISGVNSFSYSIQWI